MLRRFIVMLLGFGVPLAATAALRQDVSPTERDGRPCVECHQAIVRSFTGTRMFRAASGARFLAEREAWGSPNHCLACHAPGGGAGVACADCHGSDGHPYPAVEVPRACARCHDAPGESTVRRYLESPAQRKGRDCLGCHLPGGEAAASHGFRGPFTAGFLDGVAKVRLLLRRDAGKGLVAVVRITHRAGHALPGGTTGRSVWLVATGIGKEGASVWREAFRFGWEHQEAGSGEEGRAWRDRTLPPGRVTVIELPDAGRDGATALRAELIYRFRPGLWGDTDREAVLLDEARLDYP